MASSIRPRWQRLWQLQLLLVTLYATGLAAVIATAHHIVWYTYNFFAQHWGMIGLIAAAMYIIVNHDAVLWYKTLPACFSYVQETNFWPRPLRRRSVRRRLYRKYGDAMWAILALLVFALVLSNSAAKPSTTADKWFAKTSAQLPVHRTASKQADGTPTEFIKQVPSPPLQLRASLDTATVDVTVSMHSAAEDCRRQANAANIALPHMQPRAPTANPAPTTMPAMPDVAPGKALMKAHSRAVMLLPVLPTCPATFMVSKTVSEAPHMVVVRPLSVPSILIVLSAQAVPQMLTRPLAATALVSTHDAAVVKDMPESSLLAPMRASNFLDLKNWTPPRRLLLGACLFWLGIVIPGLRLWLTGDGDTLAAGAAIAPAEFKDPASVKIERAGKKAGHVLKRTTTSLIGTHWTGDHATTPTMSPSPAPPSVHQGQHSLLDADSILPHDASTLTDAAAMDQLEDSTSEAPLPVEDGNIPPVSAATHHELISLQLQLSMPLLHVPLLLSSLLLRSLYLLLTAWSSLHPFHMMRAASCA